MDKPVQTGSKAIKHINDSLTYDGMIPEFFGSLSSADDVGYFRSPNPSEIMTVSNASPFPDELKDHYMCSEDIAFCGCLPSIGRYYYVVDNKLFLWRSDSNERASCSVSEFVNEQEKVITSLSTMNPGRDFFSKNVNSLLAVGTPTYIKIYPIENDKICFESFYSVKIDFVPTCMCPGDFNQLIIGGSDGHLYSFQFVILTEGYFGAQQQNPAQPYVLTNLTASWIKKALLSFLSFSISPINKVCYDVTTGLIASIDNSQKINIYNYKEGSFSINYSFSLVMKLRFVVSVL